MRRTLPTAVAIIALAVVLGSFSLAHEFGLYEDDYWAVAPYLAQTPEALWSLLVECFTTWPQGRPLNHFLPPLLGFLGSRLGGLLGAYSLAAAWLTLNGTLVFLVVRRLLSPTAALAAAVAYVLFPADSTRSFLVHAAHVQGAMTFLLAGAWLWLRGGRGRMVSYLVAAPALLAYEIAFLPFLVLPLLAAAGRRRSVSMWARHLAACGSVVAVIVAVRFAKGESRALDAAGHAGEMLWRSFSSLGLGPATSGRMLLVSVPEGWRHADLHGVLSALGFALAMALALAAWGRRSSPGSPQAEGDSGMAGSLPPLSWGAVLVAGLVSWSVSYGLTLVNYPPTQTIGRLTSTHVAAGWGVALVVASLVERARRAAPRTALTVLVAVLSSWVVYQHGIQRQYVDAWSMQRRFWRQVLTLVPEASSGWTVLVVGKPAPGPGAICANSWADILVYRALVPGGEGQPVQFAHLGNLHEDFRFRRSPGGVEWQPEFWSDSPPVPIDPFRLALLHDESGSLTRVEAIDTPLGPLRSSAPIPNPPPGSGKPGPGPVGRIMFGP